MTVKALLGIAVILFVIGFGIMGVGLLIAKLNQKPDDDAE